MRDGYLAAKPSCGCLPDRALRLPALPPDIAVAARPAFQAATPSPPPQAAGGGGGGTAAAKNFSIVRSPFSSTPNTGAALPAQPLSPESELDGSPAKRLRASDGAAGHPGALHAQLAGGPASRQRPPRPPPLFSDGGSPGLADLPAGQGALASPPGVRSPGGGSSRKGRQQAKTMGRVCVECGTTTTTQVGVTGGELVEVIKGSGMPIPASRGQIFAQR